MVLRLLGSVLVLGVLTAAPAVADEPTPTPPAPSVPTPTEPTPTTAPTAPEIQTVQRPTIEGSIRYGRTVRRTLGHYTGSGLTHRTQWLRDGRPIAGATRARYTIGVRDVGHRIRVQVTVTGASGSVVATSAARVARHVRDVRHVVRYTIATRGTITTSRRTFARQVQQTLDDPRGWRAAGIRFVRVESGGSMTVVLAQASTLTSYSSACSTNWSCRVGRHVIINQTRWKHASTAWNAAPRTTLRGYRNMVVNHEVGHWLGWNHARCGGRGKLAPVMMQQSKSLAGCRFNPWPKPSERRVPRYR